MANLRTNQGISDVLLVAVDSESGSRWSEPCIPNFKNGELLARSYAVAGFAARVNGSLSSTILLPIYCNSGFRMGGLEDSSAGIESPFGLSLIKLVSFPLIMLNQFSTGVASIDATLNFALMMSWASVINQR
jgi:hypothetical protein